MADPIPENSRREQNREIVERHLGRNNPRRNAVRRQVDDDQRDRILQQELEAAREQRLRRERAGELASMAGIILAVGLIATMAKFLILDENNRVQEWTEVNATDTDFLQDILDDLENDLNAAELLRSKNGIEGILRNLHILRSLTIEVQNPIMKDKLNCFINTTEILISLDSPEYPLPGNFYNNYILELRELKDALNLYVPLGPHTNNDRVNRLMSEIECVVPVVEG